MKATVYYRGSLSSCNYDCPYCPFSKNKDSAETLAKDRAQIREFVDWVRRQKDEGHRLSLFFNPYGEGLIHRWYREAMIELSHMEHVDKVAIQTNLSARLDWVEQLEARKAAFWVTYHPGQTGETAFLKQCMTLYRQGLSFSVGSVGVKSAFGALSSLRRSLPDDVYMWVNAFKDKKNYYTEADFVFLRGIDPHFDRNAEDYASMDRDCNTGYDVFYVQGPGLVKRCYKDRSVIGHLYRDGLTGLSAKRACRMKCCDCYIGYIHMPELQLDTVYGGGLLERIAVNGSAG
ncbi:STM4011 family radical SAM protein [Paenibacillus contaminans]|uniref:Radical SAM protein n=1 Tax=Paenibacillus contaminans TaxID=450362 RepID=A0A329MJ27_9BACL|nr:STM4011 family radical SAM protein [Paenibacillus contaminans]RAV19356.1 radical SAM protein [Paenibacillus contaminans]